MRIPTAVLLILAASPVLSAPASSTPRPYHLQLEAYPAAPFPFLNKFGSITIDLYPHGVRAETFWLNGFSTTSRKSLIVENPLNRTYSDVPLSEIASELKNLSTYGSTLSGAPVLQPAMKGAVRGIDATRHRFAYGAEAWLDLWTTDVVPENAAMRSLAIEMVRGIAPGTVAALESVHGTPLYIELNFRRFKKVVLLRMKSLAFDSTGEADALKPGTLYFKAPWQSVSK